MHEIAQNCVCNAQKSFPSPQTYPPGRLQHLASPMCPSQNNFLDPPLQLLNNQIETVQKRALNNFYLHSWHALLKRSVSCSTHRPHSTQRTTGTQVFLFYYATEIMLTSLTPTST